MSDFTSNDTFHPIDLSTWPRRAEFKNFSDSGCGFTITADVDITNLLEYGEAHGVKLYPLLVGVTMKTINSHAEFRYGSVDGRFGCYEKFYPLFFERTPSGNICAMYCDCSDDVLYTARSMDETRTVYKGGDVYMPQPQLPNVVNISMAPWVRFSGVSLSLQYCAGYYTPIITYGRFEKRDGRTFIPVAIYCNHAVNDGYHADMFINEVQRISNEM